MGVRQMWQTFRDFVFSNTNRDFLVFLFFLSLSFIFWLSLTLNDTYEREFSIPVSVVDIPKNAVLTSDEVDTVKMTIRDKGIILVAYQYGDYLNRLRIPFKNYTRNNGTGQSFRNWSISSLSAARRSSPPSPRSWSSSTTTAPTRKCPSDGAVA